MKNAFFLLLFFLIINCASNKKVYWCGDHPCINNKEKKAYFKKTMVVEIRELSQRKKKSRSEIEKITQQAKIGEKRRIKSEKDLAKQARAEEKRKAREEKDLLKQARAEEKKIAKREKKIVKKKISKNTSGTSKEKIALNTGSAKIEDSSTGFDDLVKKIIKKNMFKTYPNINNIPN